MIGILTVIAAAFLSIHILVCATYFISCLRENEKRAAVLAGLQLALPSGVLGILVYLGASDLFENGGDMAALSVGVILIALIPLLLVVKTSPNSRARKGASGLVVGGVRRFDERETVTFPHQLVKMLVSRNKGARRLFTVMDDIFYGKKPKPKAPPAWAGFG